MVVYTQERLYRHPWDRVTAAAWRKFTDPASRTALSHVADVHTLHRRLDSDTGRLHAARSITVWCFSNLSTSLQARPTLAPRSYNQAVATP